MTDEEIKTREYSRRILTSRMRVLNKHPFFGLMLMHMKFSLNSELATAATDGEGIMFAPKFLDFLSDGELDFILMHEALHVALQHCLRGNDYDPYFFNVACDIVVNSNILKSNGMDKSSITVRAFGESMHLAPDGKEGYLYTAEQVYEMMKKQSKKQARSKSGQGNGSGDGSSQGQGDGSSQGQDGGNSQGQGNSDDLQNNSKGNVPNDGSGNTNGNGSQRPSDGKSGQPLSLSDTKDELIKRNGSDAVLDDHSVWGRKSSKELSEILSKRLSDAVAALKIQDPGNQRGTLPLCAERFYDELTEAKNDWRTILANFIDEDICDYSFSPPDKRYDSTGFFLPDYNEVEEKIENILFMIDTSGSVDDGLIAKCYSEIKGAIEQFDGHLSGKLGFFDAKVYEPVDFTSEEELLKIRPKGGGGTRFDIIFDFVNREMRDEPPKSIIILTDGYAPFPDESAASGIPVLWALSTKDIEPPFGLVCYIS